MLAKIFPSKIDNHYRGLPVGKGLFIVMTIMTISRSLAHILLPDGGAQSIATLPLDTFSPNASGAVIGLFAYWGLSQLMFGGVFLIVLWRYQSLIPLMSLFLVFEWVGRLALGWIKPIETMGTAPGAVGNWVLPFVTLLMLALSLKEKHH